MNGISAFMAETLDNCFISFHHVRIVKMIICEVGAGLTLHAEALDIFTGDF